MSAEKNPASERSQASKIAAAYLGDEGESEDASNHYECPKCGHANPGENQFCGTCGAAHGETVTAPERRVTDESPVTLNATASSGANHYHHHYHHNHYRSSPYLILSIFMLLAVITWQQGWEYGLRASVPSTAPLSAAAKVQPAHLPSGAEANSTPASIKAENRKLEVLSAVPWNGAYAQVTGQNPYPNELQGFTFYSKHLAPLHCGVSERAAVVRVLGDGSKAVLGWNIIPTYTTKRGSVHYARFDPLAEISIRPEGVIPMGAVRFPATFIQRHTCVSEMIFCFDVYGDEFGLEYWLHEKDSKWGRKGDLYRIAYGPRKHQFDQSKSANWR